MFQFTSSILKHEYERYVKILENSVKKYVTSDIGLASFLMLKGCKLLSAKQGARGYTIEFENTDDDCELYSLEYMNSDFMRYDMYSKNLRLMIKNRKT